MKNTSLVPLEIEILLHYYYSPQDFDNIDAPAIRECILKFCDLGLLIANSGSNSEITSKFFGNREALEVYVNALSEVPLPIQKWIIPNEKTL